MSIANTAGRARGQQGVVHRCSESVKGSVCFASLHFLRHRPRSIPPTARTVQGHRPSGQGDWDRSAFFDPKHRWRSCASDTPSVRMTSCTIESANICSIKTSDTCFRVSLSLTQALSKSTNETNRPRVNPGWGHTRKQVDHHGSLPVLWASVIRRARRARSRYLIRPQQVFHRSRAS